MKILELTFEALVDELKAGYGKGIYHAASIYREVFRKGNTDFSRVNEFAGSPLLGHQLEKDLRLDAGTITKKRNEEGTTKFVTKYNDGFEIESVVVPMFNRNTLCVSSQVGCRMNCRFCETAQLGFYRNLTVEEIVGQVYTARFRFGFDLKNIVFMGMGEPLDNFENVIKAITVLTDQRGFNFPKRRITVSTVGIADGIRKLAELNWPDLRLAVSLNAPNDFVRSGIMPINRSTPMGMLRQVLLEYPLNKSGAIMIEYVLIRGVNDFREHAAQIAEYLKPFPAKLSLIPYNPGSNSKYTAPSEQDVEQFRSWLVEEKVFVRRRATRGRKMMAACGQLGNHSETIEKHPLLPHLSVGLKF
jgi:23S rRNA (adenine2503-C2)-methyltransferase